MVSVDPPLVEQRLTRLPWVERASVTRSWPGTITVRLVERTPVATMGTGSAAVLVDEEGRVLGATSGTPALPEVAGDPPRPGRRVSAPQRGTGAHRGGGPAR